MGAEGCEAVSNTAAGVLAGAENTAAIPAARAISGAGPAGGACKTKTSSARTWNFEVEMTRARTVAPRRDGSKGRRTW
eukprot:scaffold217361_cov37-Tisochrysis_lutea.AAC.2